MQPFLFFPLMSVNISEVYKSSEHWQQLAGPQSSAKNNEDMAALDQAAGPSSILSHIVVENQGRL